MLTIIWDPDSGSTVPDNCVLAEVSNHIALLQSHAEVNHAVGSEVLLNGYRLAVARGEISSEDVRMQFEGKTVQITENAMLDEFPKNIGVNVDILSELLDIRCGISSAKRLARKEAINGSY